MGAGGHIGLAAAAVPAHGDGLGGSGGPVIDRGVGHIHAGEIADHGLKFKDGLENTLADLRLVGGVGGDELLPGGHALDHRGNKVAIGARASQQSGVDPVLLSQGGQFLPHFQLAEPLGQLQILGAEQHLLRHIGV